MRNKIIYMLLISLFLFCTKNTDSDKKKKTLLLGSFLLYSKPANPAYLCDRKVSCRKYPTSYTTSAANYSCLFNSMNFQYICIVTPFSVTGTGVLTNYYASKSDFIDESACIGLIKKTRTLYKGISFEEYINGENANTTFSSQGYPLIYSDLGWGTATATSWDSLGRPLTTSSRVDPYCSAYVKYSYDDSILKNFGDLVKSGDCPYWIYSPNERIFNQDYNEIQRNTFVQDSSGIVTFTENITINSTAEICK